MALVRNTVALVKLETTSGTDAVPTSSLNAILLSNLNLSPEGKELVRDNYRGTLSPDTHVMGRIINNLTFDTELRGAGSAYSSSNKPDVAALLQAAGFSETITTTSGSEKIVYKPKSSGFKTITAYVYLDAKLHKILGAIADVSLSAPAGEVAKLSWTLKGAYVTPVDAALPSPTLNLLKPPVVASAITTFAGSSVGDIQQFTFAMGNNIIERASMDAADGFGGLALTGRDTNGSINPLAPTEALKAWWADFEAATESALSLQIGNTQYNRCKIEAPKAQVKSIGIGDRNSEFEYSIPLRFAANAGDDELVLTFD